MNNYAIHGASASCTSVNIDLVIEYKGKDYTWWGNFDSKWQMMEVYHNDEDVDDETEEAISAIAREYLETTDVNTGVSKLSELLDNVYYEG